VVALAAEIRLCEKQAVEFTARVKVSLDKGLNRPDTSGGADPLAGA